MSALAARSPDLLGRAERSSPMPHMAARRRRGLDGESADRAIIMSPQCASSAADHILVLSETHLRRILKSHARYYNEMKTHRSLDRDAPLSRPVSGSAASCHMLSGWTASPLRPNLSFCYPQVKTLGSDTMPSQPSLQACRCVR